MTPERKDQLLNLLRISFVIGFAYLYSEGGLHDKWLRRFIAPCELGIGLTIFSRDWRSLLQIPLMMIGLSLGYGSDNFWLKILKRSYCGLILGATSAGTDWLNKQFLIAAFQTILVTVSMVILGVWNPLPNARTEEFLIGILIALFPMMSVRNNK